MNRDPSAVIEYLKEEIRVLRELLGDKRPRLTDDQRPRLAAGDGRNLLADDLLDPANAVVVVILGAQVGVGGRVRRVLANQPPEPVVDVREDQSAGRAADDAALGVKRD